MPQRSISPLQPTDPPRCERCGKPIPVGLGAGHCLFCLGQISLFHEEDEAEEIPDAVPWAVLGDHELLEEIGRGGMGVVYLARQRSLGRQVAVKVLRGGEFAGKEARQRFRAEAANVARLQHAGIVAVHEVGEEQGVAWFSMDLVQGHNLEERVRHQPMEAREAARCLMAICQAVAHAHSKGVLHRDLKPSNILLDGNEEPHITDFGIARRFGEANTSSLTRTGQMLGSPGYTAPEQALQGQADERTDVYGLGSVLYHLLTSRPPFQGPTTDAILVQLREAEPLAPRRLNPTVPRDLETICLKCLAHDPARRYATAQAVADDLTAFQNGQTIKARPISWFGKTWRWSRRHWPVATAALIAVAALLGGTVVSLIQMERAQASARKSRASEAEARRLVYSRDMLRAQQLLEEGKSSGLDLLATHVPTADFPTDLRGWEWHFLQTAAGVSTPICDAAELAEENSFALSPDGQQIAIGTKNGAIDCWDTASARHTRRFQVSTRPVTCVQWLADGQQIASCDYEGKVRLNDATDGQELQSWPLLHWTIICLRFSPDGKYFAHCGEDGRLFIRDRAGTLLQQIQFKSYGAIYWHPERPLLAFGGASFDHLAMCSPDSPQPIQNFPIKEATVLAWRPGTQQLAVASPTGRVRLLDTSEAGRELWNVTLPSGLLHDLQFTPSGDRLAVGSENNPVRMLQATDGTEINSILASDGGALTLQLTDKAGFNYEYVNGIRKWSLEAPRFNETKLTVPSSGAVRSLTWSADGQRLHAVCVKGDTWQAPVWDRQAQQWLPPIAASALGSGMCAWSPDGKRLARVFTPALARSLHIFSWPEGELIASQRLAALPTDLRWNPAGTSLAMTLPGRGTVLYSVDNHRESVLPVLTGFIHAPEVMLPTEWSADGRSIVICTQRWLYHVDPPEPSPAWPGYSNEVRDGMAVMALSWQPQGQLVAVTRQDTRIELRAAADAHVLRSTRSHRSTIRTLAWHPSGTRLASSDIDGTVKLFDADTLDELLSFSGQQRDVRSLAWTPDGTTLASGDADGVILVRDSSPE